MNENNDGLVFQDNVVLEANAQLTYSVQPPPTCVTFTAGKDTFTLSWKDGVLTYEGNVDKGAKAFLEVLKPFLEAYIKENTPYNNLEYLAWKHEQKKNKIL